MGRVLIGTSGFSYPHWGKGVFYPPHLKPQDWLAYYSHYFDTLEINSSFYRLPTEKTLNRWRDVTPADFTFAVNNNDACGYAVQNALQLKQLIKKYGNNSDLKGSC